MKLDEVLALLDELDKAEAEAEAEAAKPRLNRKIYTLANKKSGLVSDARLLREEDVPALETDQAADKCYENFGDVYNFFSDLFERNSIDDKGLPLIGMVHYGTNVANAVWLPDRKLMWFGDGFSRDSVDVAKPSSNFAGYFGNFHNSLELVAHELVHGITTSVTKVFAYGETGALAEHIADAFGIMVKQYKFKQTVNEADWLIGQDIILPELEEMALRSFKSPGNAYVLPSNLGKDKQVAHMRQFVVTTEDNGGVHINSGILNHAFYLAAMEIGGYSWEKLGKIWWKTLVEGKIIMSRSNNTWIPFAQKTVEFAKEQGQDVQNAVSNAWKSVGVLSN